MKLDSPSPAGFPSYKKYKRLLSAWGIPAIYAGLAIAAGLTFPRLESRIFPGLVSPMSVSAATAIYSAIASGMIALTGIVFSLTFVMVQFSATAYSPRLVLWIARDPVMSHALGMFTATFLYAIAALAGVDRNGSGKVPFVSALVVVALLLASVGMFIALIQRIGLLQINRMLVFTGDQGRQEYTIGRHIAPRFEGLLLEQVDKQAIQCWVNDLATSNLAPKTVSNIVKILKSILSWSDVVTSGWKLRLPEIPEDEQRWFAQEEAERIIRAAEGQYKVLFRVAYATGMRAGELFGLHVDDFNFGAGTVRVLRSTFRNIEDTPKSRKGRRTIYVDSHTLEEVRRLLAGRTSGRVFMTKLGTPLKVGDVNRYVLRPICKKLGIPHGGMHAFRHGRVSKMQDEGVNEKIIQLEVGHSSLRMMRRYTHFSDEQRRATAERLAM